jgi:hypothetical protein
VSAEEVAARIMELVGRTRPAVVAVNGHSSSGKTTLASGLASALPNCAVVHTDDIAWHHAVLDWGDLLLTGILAPVRAGEAVSFRPPAWAARGRAGAIEVPAGIEFLVVEGVGSGRREFRPHVDAVVFVDTDEAVRRARDAVRVATGEISPQGYLSWMREEDAFFALDRPWEHADVVVPGNADPAGGSGRAGSG